MRPTPWGNAPLYHALLVLGMVAGGILCSSGVQAQGFGPGPRTPTRQQGPQDTKTGPAEEAPEQAEGEPEIPPLPAWPAQQAKRLELFQLNGYFRFRWNMYHNLNLGQQDVGGLKAPFYRPISEQTNPITGELLSGQACANRVDKPVPGGGDRDLSSDDCPGSTLGGANLRLRLEPTINISQSVRVNARFDVLDNLEMGSTPQGLFAQEQAANVPLSFFADDQAPPVAGLNDPGTAFVVKRVWAEVNTALGWLRFGRMGSHWGLGLLDNDGSCWDCDFGTNVDRIMFTIQPAGYTFEMGYDFSSSGPNSLGVESGLQLYGGRPVDLEKLDDVHQWFWMLGRIDSEEVVRDKVDRGELVVNYGLYLLWRSQDFGYSDLVGFGSSMADYSAAMVERHAWTLTPDLWFRLLWGKLSLEFEGLFRGGKVENIANTDTEDPLDIYQFGWALRSQYKFLKDSLKVGLEVGMASGDQAEPANADINRRRSSSLTDSQNAGDTSLREFRFNSDYHVDRILFRELMTTVANATYFKPWIQYDLLDTLGARLDLIYSLANEPVAFPGNSRNLGLELDLDIYYQNPTEGFYAGLIYAVLFPFGALERPASIYGAALADDADIAHVLQGRLIVKF